jgi:hypothetical protein
MKIINACIFILISLGCTRSPKSNSIEDQWFIVENPGSVIAYENNHPPYDAITLGQYERFRIVESDGNYHKIKTESGLRLYVFKKTTRLVRYSIKKHPSNEVLHRIAYERAKCSDFSSQSAAISAFKANPSILSELDADGDGEPCEYCYKWTSNPSHSISDDTPSTSTGGDIQVQGHYRTTKSGKKIWVKPHTRKK